jgi:hypothetical protein
VTDLSTILLTATATLLVAVVAALLGARLQATHEQAKWLRERRHEVCATMLKSIDWADLAQKVDAERPTALPAPVDLYAELDVLGLDGVRAAARDCADALFEINLQVSQAEHFDGDLYARLQGAFDEYRAIFVAEVRRVLGITGI